MGTVPLLTRSKMSNLAFSGSFRVENALLHKLRILDSLL